MAARQYESGLIEMTNILAAEMGRRDRVLSLSARICDLAQRTISATADGHPHAARCYAAELRLAAEVLAEVTR